MNPACGLRKSELPSASLVDVLSVGSGGKSKTKRGSAAFYVLLFVSYTAPPVLVFFLSLATRSFTSEVSRAAQPYPTPPAFRRA